MSEVPPQEHEQDSERRLEIPPAPPDEAARDLAERYPRSSPAPDLTAGPEGARSLPEQPPSSGHLPTSSSPPDAWRPEPAPAPFERPTGSGGEARPTQPIFGEPAVAAPPAEQISTGRSFVRGLREVAETIILALLIFLLVRAVVQNFQVEGSSMQPTLETRWYLLVNKAVYFEINLETMSKFIPFIDPGDDPTRYVFRGPKRGDVIVFKAPNAPNRDFIKRVIAMPGETVEVRAEGVYINGQFLDEPYIKEKQHHSTFAQQMVPAGHLFVLGDNRNNSSDSRVFGMLPKENIIGRAWLTYWPFSIFGRVDNTSVEPGSGSPPEKEPAAAAPVGASP